MTLKIDEPVIISSSLKNFELPKINTKKLTDFEKWQKVNENNLKIYRDKLKTINASLNFLNQFIRNHLDDRNEEWLLDRKTLTAFDFTKELINDNIKRKHISEILWINLEIIEKESKNIDWKIKSLNIKADYLKEKIFDKILELNNLFLILTETNCKNFPILDKNLSEKNLNYSIEINKNTAKY